MDTNYPASSLAYSDSVFATAPSGGAWTQAKLNSARIRFGYSPLSGLPNLQGVILEVAFAGTVQTIKGAGYLWVETTDLHYIDASNQERVITGATTL